MRTSHFEKYSSLVEAEDRLFDIFRKRLTHLQQVFDGAASQRVLKDYFTRRLNRVIADYLLREGHFVTASAFITDAGLEVNLYLSQSAQEFADVEVFEESSRILSRLRERDCREALEWCNTHKTKLQKTNVMLFYSYT